jgi:nucleotidyltransferase/DNA polymerase involved in DNA repair
MARHGLAAVAVSSASARIGDALSTYHDGIVSAANEPARAKGVTIGMQAAEAARLMLG